MNVRYRRADVRPWFLAAFCVCAFNAMPAYAGSNSVTIHVTATVAPGCTVPATAQLAAGSSPRCGAAVTPQISRERLADMRTGSSSALASASPFAPYAWKRMNAVRTPAGAFSSSGFPARSISGEERLITVNF